jgi:hypothetical protein
VTDQLLPIDRAAVSGIPCTSVVRTVCDLAAILGRDDLELVIEDALRRNLTTVERLRWRNELLGGRRGTARLRELLLARLPGRAAESPWEVRLAQLLRRAHLPEPVRQFDVFDDAGAFVARLDLAYPDRRLAVEFDSERWHSGRQKLDEQSARSNRLTHAGWRVVHATSTSMSDAAAMAMSVAIEYDRSPDEWQLRPGKRD